MTPSDVIDLNRPMATGRLMPPVLVQEKAGLLKGRASTSGNMMRSRVHANSNISDASRTRLFPIAEDERVKTTRQNERLRFLLGEIADLKTPRTGLFLSLKRMIIRPLATPSTPDSSCSTLSHAPQPASPIRVPLEESPLFKAMTIGTPSRDEILQPNTSELFGSFAYQGLYLQLRMAMASTCTPNRAVIRSPKTTETSPQPLFARPTPSGHIFNSSTNLVTPAMKSLFVEAVSEEATEAYSSSFPLIRVLPPLERAISEARSAGYHLHKSASLAQPPSSPTPSHTWSVETQHVLHGDGLRRLVLCKNASVYPAPESNGEVNKNSSSSSSASNADIHGVDYELFLRRIGRGVGDDWICRVRVMPSTVNLDVRLWDSKRSEDDKIEVQLGKPLLRSSPLKRLLNNSIRKDSVELVELERSRPIRSRLRSARSNIHRRRVVIDIGAKGTDESTPSLAPVTPERSRDRIRNRIRAKRTEGTSESLDTVRRWSDKWKRRARLMATPKPEIEASHSEQTQGASALSAIPAATTVDRRSGWSKFRKHLKSHNGYLEEDTSDEEPMEHDDEDDDICHTRCKPVFVSLPSPVERSPSSKLSNIARLAVQFEKESQDKVPATMDHGKHSQEQLLHVHPPKTVEHGAKRT